MPSPYWPRTVRVSTSSELMGWMACRIFALLVAHRVGSNETGGSIAVMLISCMMWLGTMSRNAPTLS